VLSIDAGASFNVAAKHLFRHLHDVRALRRNRLVRHAFEYPTSGSAARERERIVLDRIHDLVRRGAEHCRDSDLAEGKDERAARQHAIVTLQCLQNRPIREVAATLGISCAHCYRERADICKRIARYICECNAPVELDYLPYLDEFAVMADRAMRRSAFGDVEAAARECDNLVRFAPSAEKKVKALRVSAIVSLHFGNVKRAENAYLAAQRLCADERWPESSPAREAARASVDLIASRLAYYRADGVLALRMAERGTQRLEFLRGNPSPEMRELLIESLYELGSALCNVGNLPRGYELIDEAKTQLRDARSASFQLRARVAIAVWKLRDDLLMNSACWYPSWQRVKGLTQAFERAYASGFIFEAVIALVALMEYHSIAGNDAEALRVGRFAIFLSKQQTSERVRIQTSIRVAFAMQSTRYWMQGFSLLPNTEELASCDRYHRELVSHFAAQRAFRSRAFSEAWALAKDDGDRRETAALAISRRLIAADAAHELERKDARALIEAALPAAEHLGCAPILKDAYAVAAKITGSVRFRRQADELARLLTA
jgi:hypothetical protein